MNCNGNSVIELSDPLSFILLVFHLNDQNSNTVLWDSELKHTDPLNKEAVSFSRKTRINDNNKKLSNEYTQRRKTVCRAIEKKVVYTNSKCVCVCVYEERRRWFWFRANTYRMIIVLISLAQYLFSLFLIMLAFLPSPSTVPYFVSSQDFPSFVACVFLSFIFPFKYIYAWQAHR